jgi:signal transduction histidine kinase
LPSLKVISFLEISLFEHFYRSESARDRQTEGLGLGLSLALEIARAYGGDLGLDPSYSGEIQVYLRLPAFSSPGRCVSG